MGWFKYNLENDYTCFIARCKGSIIGYVWWCDFNVSSKFHDLDVKVIRDTIKLKDDDVYCSDYFISPEYRGGGNSNEFFCKVLSALKEIGYNRALGVVPAQNRAARWTYKIVGYSEIKSIADRRLFTYIVLKDRELYFDRNGRHELFRVDDRNKA
jgi:GNAT superfamily N-acetyltransferase